VGQPQEQATGRIKLAYGDVLTTKPSQGATVSEHIFAVPGLAPGQRFRRLHVRQPASRAVIHRDLGWAERQEVAGRRPLGDKRQVGESDVVENVARNFARQPVKEDRLR